MDASKSQTSILSTCTIGSSCNELFDNAGKIWLSSACAELATLWIFNTSGAGAYQMVGMVLTTLSEGLEPTNWQWMRIWTWGRLAGWYALVGRCFASQNSQFQTNNCIILYLIYLQRAATRLFHSCFWCFLNHSRRNTPRCLWCEQHQLHTIQSIKAQSLGDRKSDQSDRIDGPLDCFREISQIRMWTPLARSHQRSCKCLKSEWYSEYLSKWLPRSKVVLM